MILIDELINANEDVSDLTLMSKCMNEFGEFYHKMTLKDWHRIVKLYREKKEPFRFDIEEETDTMSSFVAESFEESCLTDQIDSYTIDEDEIEHVYVDIPSAEPYKEYEYEPENIDDEKVNDIVETDPPLALKETVTLLPKTISFQ